MSEVTKHDVLDAADALLDRLELIAELNEILPSAESGDTHAMREAADLFARTGRPQLATYWRKKAGAQRQGKARRVGTAASST